MKIGAASAASPDRVVRDQLKIHRYSSTPLEPFAIRGAIWYQGESNAERADGYSKLLPAMIADWRKPLNCGNFNVKTGKCGGRTTN